MEPEESVEGQEDRIVGDIMSGFALKLSTWYALPVNPEHLGFMVLSSSLAHHRDVIEFCIPDRLARAAASNLATLTPSHQEADFLVSRIPKRLSSKSRATKLASNDIFKEKAKNVEVSLSCTLAEAASKELWASPLVKVACVLAFQFAHSPVPCLEQIFGSLVRSDLRRCDDLHEREAADPMDIVVLGELLECAAFAIVS